MSTSTVVLITTTGTITRTFNGTIDLLRPAVQAACLERGDVLRATITDEKGNRYVF